LVFRTVNIEIGWDGSHGTEGRKVSDGLFTYRIQVMKLNQAEPVVITGHVNLIR